LAFGVGAFFYERDELAMDGVMIASNLSAES
jgi:hypothetical protein